MLTNKFGSELRSRIKKETEKINFGSQLQSSIKTRIKSEVEKMKELREYERKTKQIRSAR